MDAFLRRVIAQRELEQESAILATPLETFVRRCRLCGRRIGGDSEWACRVCTECGGLKVHERLEREDLAAAARAARLQQLVRLAGFQPQPQEHLMSDRKCTKCEKPLRSNNQHDTCHACRLGGPISVDADGGGQPVPRKAKAQGDVVKRFKVVATALGVDPDKLIGEFCEGWLARVRSSADFGNPG